jgi:putative sigma-54 modulation protein
MAKVRSSFQFSDYESCVMETQVVTRGLTLTAAQDELINRRLQFGLGRFARRIRRVDVTFSDVNGPKGGNDIQCRIKLLLHRKGELVVSDTSDTVETVISSVTARVAMAVNRLVGRHQNRQPTPRHELAAS